MINAKNNPAASTLSNASPKIAPKGKGKKVKGPPARSARYVSDLVALRLRAGKSPNGKDSVRLSDDAIREIGSRIWSDLGDKSFTTVSVGDANGKTTQASPMALYRTLIHKDRYAIPLDWDTLRAV